MRCTRKEFFMSLPALAGATSQISEKPSLPSRAFRFEDLPVRSRGQNTFRSVLDGATHWGLPIEVHETDLAPGEMPHPPHHHRHEEMFLIREGTVEVTLAGDRSRLGPGSAAFVASNEEHGIRNVGTGHAQYFVLALGRD